jgi:hypothetical protein
MGSGTEFDEGFARYIHELVAFLNHNSPSAILSMRDRQLVKSWVVIWFGGGGDRGKERS